MRSTTFSQKGPIQARKLVLQSKMTVCKSVEGGMMRSTGVLTSTLDLRY